MNDAFVSLNDPNASFMASPGHAMFALPVNNTRCHSRLEPEVLRAIGRMSP